MPSSTDAEMAEEQLKGRIMARFTEPKMWSPNTLSALGYHRNDRKRFAKDFEEEIVKRKRTGNRRKNLSAKTVHQRTLPASKQNGVIQQTKPTL